MGSRLASVITCAALAAGCVQVSDFEPVGDAASLAFTWTIDGVFPTRERCEEFGASAVRVTFVDGLRPVVHGGLVRPCASCSQDSEASCFSTRPCMQDGTVECYDTEDSRVVAEGEWTIRVEAIDSAGSVIQASPEAMYSTESGRIELAPASFLSSRVSATTTLDEEAPTVRRCDEAAIGSVALAFLEASGEVARDPVEACAIGGVGTRVAPGTYTVQLRAMDAEGGLIGESAPETFTLAPGEQATLNGGEPIELLSL